MQDEEGKKEPEIEANQGNGANGIGLKNASNGSSKDSFLGQNSSAMDTLVESDSDGRFVAPEGFRYYLSSSRAENQPDAQHDPPTVLFELLRNSDEKIYVCWPERREGVIRLIYASQKEHDGQTYRVPAMPPVLAHSLLLPTDQNRYGTTRDLFYAIQSMLREYVGLPVRQCSLLSYWSLATWFPDRLEYIPRVTVTGPPMAADHLFRVLRCACRRPILLSGLNSSTFRSIAIEQLTPTLFIRGARLSRTMVDLLDAGDHRDYLMVAGKDVLSPYCGKCIYLGEHGNQISDPAGIHIHVEARHSMMPTDVPDEGETLALQNRLLRYRLLNHHHVGRAPYSPQSVFPEFSYMVEQLANVIVDDDDLKTFVPDLLTEASEQAKADRSMTETALVLRALLNRCHEGDDQVLHVKKVAQAVNDMYEKEGEPLKVSNERVGHLLKNIGLYTRRLGSFGRGLLLDRATRTRVHELGLANAVLSEGGPAVCEYCDKLREERDISVQIKKAVLNAQKDWGRPDQMGSAK